LVSEATDLAPHRALWRPLFTGAPLPIVQNAGLEPLAHQPGDALVADSVSYEAQQPRVVYRFEEALDIGVENPVHALALDRHAQGVQCVVLAPPGPEPVREAEEVFLVDRIEHCDDCTLDDLPANGARTLPALQRVRRLRSRILGRIALAANARVGRLAARGDDMTEISMDQETFNLSIRKFLKTVGVSSQREIEQAVAKAIAAGTISGAETLAATMTLRIAGLQLEVRFDSEIQL
jgi:Family of unknown function (DUF6494)